MNWIKRQIVSMPRWAGYVVLGILVTSLAAYLIWALARGL